MNDFNLVYTILRVLQKTMDCEERDLNSLSAEGLGVSVPRRSRIMALLINEGYITGAQTWNAMDCDYPRVKLIRPEITLKGLEYVEENKCMKKAANAAKGVIETVSSIPIP